MIKMEIPRDKRVIFALVTLIVLSVTLCLCEIYLGDNAAFLVAVAGAVISWTCQAIGRRQSRREADNQ